MQITDFHAQYYAYELTRKFGADNPEKLTSALADAQVDLNPHQIDAALFAFKSPFSKGCLLADEVGLGKTIEAGIVLSQKWAERKRKMLILVPSSLRKQWQQELQDKFFLPSIILESRNFNSLKKQGTANPFEHESIVICSYHFARNKADFVGRIKWDLVTIDEAHRLRNVYKKNNKIGKAIKEATQSAPKILLTATPLQNSLLELFGLVSLIDEYVFGDIRSFKAQYCQSDNLFDHLKARLAPFCKRTLRRQVLEYIKYTNRIPLTQEFTPSKAEQKLYDVVSGYLQREKLMALPKGQRTLITLVLRKLLASSSFAISNTLSSLINRLEKQLKDNVKLETAFIDTELSDDYEIFEENKDEWGWENVDDIPEPLSEEDKKLIHREIEDLKSFLELSQSITKNEKGKSLLIALGQAFSKTEELGSAKKALIFTESRRTQEYIASLLEANGYQDKIVFFNGSNNDEKSKSIYKAWVKRFAGTDKVTGSRTADIRSALVDYFKEEAEVMIATEAAAEGINLQFCSLIVNYDLPWNPQRIEQRIGRCHRYGQQHDVVVVNFINRNNAADQRVFELLSEKFQLFEGVFGASDEILGSIESGVDFEQRIAAIYQKCRSDQDIQRAFDTLQQKLQGEIGTEVKKAHQTLLENFDEAVTEKLRISLKYSQAALDKHEQRLWQLAKHLLPSGVAEFSTEFTFTLHANPFTGEVPLGKYRMGSQVEDAHIFRPHSALAVTLLDHAKGQDLTPQKITFDYSGGDKVISILEPFIGNRGVLALDYLQVQSVDVEDVMLFAGQDAQGNEMDQEQCERLFSLAGRAEATEVNLPPAIEDRLAQRHQEVLVQIATRNGQYFDGELDKLEDWADDLKSGLEWEIKNLDKEIKLRKNESRTLLQLEKKLAAQREIKNLEKKRNQLRQNLFKAQDEVDGRKETLLDELELRLRQTEVKKRVFVLEWAVT